jgi:hypothetical protein
MLHVPVHVHANRRVIHVSVTPGHRPATLRGESPGTEGTGRWLVFKAVEKFGRRAKAPCSRVTLRRESRSVVHTMNTMAGAMQFSRG